MPPKKRPSTAHAEGALAERILLERERRGWSPAGLASRMTQAGCPMTQSAVWKIENGNPRRRITFDEAVVFAKVFEMNLEELAQPREVVQAERASDLVTQLRKDAETRIALQDRWGRSIFEIESLIASDETGRVCQAVNLSRLSSGELLIGSNQFDVETWKTLPARSRRALAEHWANLCIEEDEIRRIRLAPEDVPQWERAATRLEAMEELEQNLGEARDSTKAETSNG